MIALVGGPPSSGSTYFADLLDSTSCSACGPEIAFFANHDLYSDFKKFKKTFYRSSQTASIYSKRMRIKYNYLSSYNLSRAAFIRLVSSSENAGDYAEKIRSHFISWRGKDPSAVLFEKTPENIQFIEPFLNTFHDAHFVFCVRNPLFVFRSMKKRGATSYQAIGSWLIEVSHYIKIKNHPRIIILKYEALTASPFKATSDILNKIQKHPVTEDDVKTGYGQNLYRTQLSQEIKKIDTWTFNQYGKTGNANQLPPNEQLLEEFAPWLNVCINKKYAAHFKIPEITFWQAIKELGYEEDIRKLINNISTSSKQLSAKTPADNYFLSQKWFRDFIRNEAGLKDISTYLNPLSPYK